MVPLVFVAHSRWPCEALVSYLERPLVRRSVPVRFVAPPCSATYQVRLPEVLVALEALPVASVQRRVDLEWSVAPSVRLVPLVSA